MAAVTASRLSFDHDLRHAYTPLMMRLQNGGKSLDGILEILRMRIEAETQFTNSLQKIIGCSTNLICHISKDESLRSDGLEALYCDLKNEYIQRISFLQSLRDDVEKPLNTMKHTYFIENKQFVNQTKNAMKSLKQQQNEFVKLKTKYDKIMNNGDQNNENHENHQNKKQQQQLLMIQKRFNKQQLIYKGQQQVFENKMLSTLQSMESIEYKRMNSLRDGLTNWSAYITNYCANRMYDIQSLNKSMSLIEVESDLQIFMKKTLTQYPSSRYSQSTQQQKQYKSKYNIGNAQNSNLFFIVPNLKGFKQKFQKQSITNTSMSSLTSMSSTRSNLSLYRY